MKLKLKEYLKGMFEGFVISVCLNFAVVAFITPFIETGFTVFQILFSYLMGIALLAVAIARLKKLFNVEKRGK